VLFIRISESYMCFQTVIQKCNAVLLHPYNLPQGREDVHCTIPMNKKINQTYGLIKLFCLIIGTSLIRDNFAPVHAMFVLLGKREWI
jgi:hypothetical protein